MTYTRASWLTSAIFYQGLQCYMFVSLQHSTSQLVKTI